MRAWFLIAALFVWSAGAATAESTEIIIGGVEAQLGMSESDLMPKLRELYGVNVVRPGVYQIAQKENAEMTVAVVEFREGKLTWASRDLGAYEGEPVSQFGHAFFAAVEATKIGDSVPIRISTDQTKTPGYAVKVITLEFPDRKIVLYVGDGADSIDLSMEEIVISADSPSYQGASTQAAASLQNGVAAD